MTEFVRVKDATTGAESTVPKRFAEAYKGKDLTILTDKAAVDANGRPLAAKSVPADLRKKDTEPKADGDNGGNTPADPPVSEPMSTDTKPKGGTAK